MLMKPASRRVVIFAAVLLIVLIIALLFILRSPPVTEYVTAPVRIGDIENSVLATGRIDAIERVNVGAQVSGQVKSLKVKAGDRVTKGQRIADIDDVPQRNDLRNAEAALNVVKADLQAKQALLKQAELRYKRQRQMLNEEASSREDFESAEATLATTRAELLSLNARLVQAQIEVDKKKVDLSYTRVVAPMDGIVIAVVTQQGQTVMASNNDVALAALRMYRARLDAERVGITNDPGLKGTLGVDSRKQLNGSHSWEKGNSATLITSYELDLWGKIARQRDAAVWASQATEEDLRSARLNKCVFIPKDGG